MGEGLDIGGDANREQNIVLYSSPHPIKKVAGPISLTALVDLQTCSIKKQHRPSTHLEMSKRKELGDKIVDKDAMVDDASGDEEVD